MQNVNGARISKKGVSTRTYAKSPKRKMFWEINACFGAGRKILAIKSGSGRGQEFRTLMSLCSRLPGLHN